MFVVIRIIFILLCIYCLGYLSESMSYSQSLYMVFEPKNFLPVKNFRPSFFFFVCQILKVLNFRFSWRLLRLRCPTALSFHLFQPWFLSLSLLAVTPWQPCPCTITNYLFLSEISFASCLNFLFVVLAS